MTSKGFTLIEILIVVAIIAILAVISTVNFQHAQVRSKISRVNADLASMASALESYHVDNNNYPNLQAGIGLSYLFYTLTTPVAYITDIPTDPFTKNKYKYLFFSQEFTSFDALYGKYVLYSYGPDLLTNTSYSEYLLYDPTNGNASPGDILRTQKASQK